MASLPHNHAALMDSVYRGQRHIYDATRKYFLFGRDRLIDGLGLLPGGSLLEIGCGTGRNLASANTCWPGGHLFGLDISELMLKSARAKLGRHARLAPGDACGFAPRALFGQPTFDRVMISFALSMIPDWKSALAMGCDVIAPGGSLHIVDFGDGSGLPALARKALNRWLAHFHVTPRPDLADTAWQIARERGLRVETISGPLGYYQIVVVRKAR